MAYEQIQVDIKTGVATITLNRPEKLNAYTAQMGTEIHRAFAELDARLRKHPEVGEYDQKI